MFCLFDHCATAECAQHTFLTLVLVIATLVRNLTQLPMYFVTQNTPLLFSSILTFSHSLPRS
jgi:hypothetical protein